MPLNLKSLIGKLNGPTRRAMEAAAGLCMSRTNYDIEIEHYLLKLLDNPDTDVPLILKQYGIDQSRLQAELMRSLDHLKTGNSRSPAFSPMLLKMFTEAWSIGSIDYDAAEIRTGFTLLALLANDELARTTRDISKELQKIPVEGLRQDLPVDCFVLRRRAGLAAGSRSRATLRRHNPPLKAAPRHRQRHRTWTSTPSIMTANAKAGKIDTVLGRDQRDPAGQSTS